MNGHQYSLVFSRIPQDKGCSCSLPKLLTYLVRRIATRSSGHFLHNEGQEQLMQDTPKSKLRLRDHERIGGS